MKKYKILGWLNPPFIFYLYIIIVDIAYVNLSLKEEIK
jgi:hypothetical protein